MKTKYIIFPVFLALILACTDDFGDYNTDIKRPPVVTGEALFTNAQKSLADQLSTPNVNLNVFNLFAQYWTETTYTDEANYDLVNRFIADNTFQEYYRDVLRDFKESSRLIAQQIPDEFNTAQDITNKRMIIKLLMVYAFQNLVDIFGDIPYTEALDIENLLPAYDNAGVIYSSLIDSTNAALSGMVATGNAGFGTADLIYGGDVDAWIKFGNSLKIKLGITIADANMDLSKSTVESAVAGAFTSSEDDARFPYQSGTPNTNKIYEELVLTGRNDFIPANTIVDLMNDLDDPRRPAYFTLIDTSTEANVEKLAYLGGAYGESSPFTQFSHVADAIQAPTFEGIVLTYDEILFYLAEAAARGYTVGASDEELYNMAVTASFDFWDVPEDSAVSYLARPDVAWSTSPGDFRQKIGTQSWIAFYTRGLEGYTQWRRLDFPIFNMPPTISSYDEIPVRFTYPIGEQTLNAENYAAASDAIGEDLLTTQVFWDMFPER